MSSNQRKTASISGMNTERCTSKKRTQDKKRTFVSKAQQKELREYQHLASKFPPLSHDATIALSKRFVTGREARVTLEEHDMVLGIVNGDLSPDNAIRKRDTILDELSKKINIERDATMKDLVDCWTNRLKLMQDDFDNEISRLRAIDDDYNVRNELLDALRDGKQALDAIVLHNMQFAMSRVGRVLRNNKRAVNVDIQDLIEVANMGLVMGARQFDPSMGRKFSTYVAFHIDGQLYALLNQEDGNSGIVGRSVHEQKQLNTLVHVASVFRQLYSRDASIQELYSLTGIAPSIIEIRLNEPKIQIKNVYSPIFNNEINDSNETIADILVSTDDIEEEVVTEHEYSYALSVLREEIMTLPVSYRMILCAKIGMNETTTDMANKIKSTKQIANEMGITSEEVTQRYNEAISMLKRQLMNRGVSSDSVN